MKKKQCKKCKQKYPLSNFHKSKTCKDGFRVICGKCVGKQKRKIYKENREKFIEYKRQYRQKNLEKLRQQNNELKHRKKDQINKRRNKLRKIRKKRDIGYKILQNMRRRINDVLKGKNKSQTTMNLLGCSIEFFKAHIERQFVDGMNWNNYGFYGWHLDHIIPCSSFDLIDPEQQRKCFHYSNLQPLWWYDNLSKSDKIIL